MKNSTMKETTYWASSEAEKYSSLYFFVGKLATTTGSRPCKPRSSCTITKRKEKKKIEQYKCTDRAEHIINDTNTAIKRNES